ncbi:hypothetical protein PI124_g11231 [Phytophthora idaei]|nr:hypothetical protein PI125_g11320 [Phytophthora idaei]KAG3152275.1 hypothetical protein PI126_g10578 [Phytophthora idaei]KAG3243940.1 hypothetical protein PI124_g11231 [Phytophthora idaei]
MDDQELADRLTLLRITATADLEEILRARDRAKTRQKGSAFESKYQQSATPLAPAASTKRAIQAPPAQPSSGSEASGSSDSSDAEGDLRQFVLAPAGNDSGRSRLTDSRRTAPMLIKAIIKLATDVMVHTISPDAHTVAHASTTT